MIALIGPGEEVRPEQRLLLAWVSLLIDAGAGYGYRVHHDYGDGACASRCISLRGLPAVSWGALREVLVTDPKVPTRRVVNVRVYMIRCRA